MESISNSEQKEQKKEATLHPILQWFYDVIVAFNKFRRSSFLSIIILIIMLLLVKGLDQAYTLLVDMIEDKNSYSLLLCYTIISVFALVISHYPIYIYYAKDINDSKDENFWYIHKLWFYNIFTFSKKPIEAKPSQKAAYSQDYKAKFFRHALGISIFSIWAYYIYKSYEPKLYYVYEGVSGIIIFNWIICLIPYILLIIFLRKKQKTDNFNSDYKKQEDTNDNAAVYDTFYKKGVLSFYMLMLFSIVLLLWAAFLSEFNLTSYYLLQLLTFLLSVTYISFRLFRSKLDVYLAIPFIKKIAFSYNYVSFFFVIALLLFGMLVYCNIGVAYGKPLPNAMAVLFAYFFIFYYILTCALKSLFVIQAIKRQSNAYEKGKITKKVYEDYSGLTPKGINRLVKLKDQKSFVKGGNVITLIVLGFILFCSLIAVISPKWNESYVHELDTDSVRRDDSVLPLNNYMDSLRKKIKNNKKPLIFVASHGGALKANIWTMKLLNHIQEETEGEFLDQTASFSGASGGMMGLGMYSVLSGKYNNKTKNRFKNIENRINKVASENYASSDVSYMLGWDFIRKMILLRKVSKHKDRAYYSMVTYQNLLEKRDTRMLDTVSFQGYWYDNIYKKNDYFPAILVNTAKTNGRRGVFSSVRYDDDEDLFLNADNLAQLQPIVDGKRPVVSFYQALSCTNRFPGFSPAAKISGYGHYIDAGAIDNSGLLTSLDWYDRLKNGDKPVIMPETNVIFVEIINGKSNYIKYLLRAFKEKYDIDFLEFEEEEQGNLSAVISAGVNLDKNPDYFSDLIRRLEKRGRKPLEEIQFQEDSIYNANKFSIRYIPIYLPRVITLDDVESFVGGDVKELIINSKGKEIHARDSLIKFLKERNKEIYDDTENISESGNWETYEPTLARHLSPSTIKYYDRILKNNDTIIERIQELKDELNKK
ncbi:hypothetical protein C8N46_102541 [Kordia periserrulae]|uniref:Patatin-like phospholipase n=1 Tax=Kordia periserrulae TaxID=701523 RepID=A0A2T6C4A4_9FLAO|nr:patatin-like phospholipase family protein [Kordia periserrulae]PTX63138.1 hypothetical protein C8N46_102541 [Kordia periserrulae]